MSHTDWETWLIEVAGHSVIENKVRSGTGSLSDAERLTYCLWAADYGMRNAGDLKTAADLHPNFQIEGAELAERLALPTTAQVFRLAILEFEAVYFQRFDEMCSEVSSALSAD